MEKGIEAYSLNLAYSLGYSIFTCCNLMTT
jgi:hypothetical protein